MIFAFNSLAKVTVTVKESCYRIIADFYRIAMIKSSIMFRFHSALWRNKNDPREKQNHVSGHSMPMSYLT
jgi:hypothetical protein